MRQAGGLIANRSIRGGITATALAPAGPRGYLARMDQTEGRDNEALKLLALDAEDLAVVSAHLQDAVAKVADMAFLPAEKRFAMLVNRFDWAAAERGQSLRRRAGVRFERVLGAQARGISLGDKDSVLNLLAVEFEEQDSPSGFVTLFFSGGAAIRLQVECLEGELSDLGPAWPTRAKPTHETAS
jgi:hypothetical protein